MTYDLMILGGGPAGYVAAERAGARGMKVLLVEGRGILTADRKIRVDGQAYEGTHILVATGSSPARPPIPGLDRANVVDSTGILSLDALPRSLAVIGGGVIGCEFACFFGSIGHPGDRHRDAAGDLSDGGPGHREAAAQRTAQRRTSPSTPARRWRPSNEAGVRFSSGGGTQTVDADLILVATGRTLQRRGPRTGRAAASISTAAASGSTSAARPTCRASGPRATCTGRAWLAHAGLAHGRGGRCTT